MESSRPLQLPSRVANCERWAQLPIQMQDALMGPYNHQSWCNGTCEGQCNPSADRRPAATVNSSTTALHGNTPGYAPEYQSILQCPVDQRPQHQTASGGASSHTDPHEAARVLARIRQELQVHVVAEADREQTQASETTRLTEQSLDSEVLSCCLDTRSMINNAMRSDTLNTEQQVQTDGPNAVAATEMTQNGVLESDALIAELDADDFLHSPTYQVEAVIDVAQETSEMLDWLHNFVPADGLPIVSEQRGLQGSRSSTDALTDASIDEGGYSSDFIESDDENSSDYSSYSTGPEEDESTGRLSVAVDSGDWDDCLIPQQLHPVTRELQQVIETPGSPLLSSDTILTGTTYNPLSPEDVRRGISAHLEATDAAHPLQHVPDCTSYYSVLGVQPEASLEEIEAGHSYVLDRYDPQAVAARYEHLPARVQQALRGKYRRVTALADHALQTLITPKLRRRYNAELASDMASEPVLTSRSTSSSVHGSQWAVGEMVELSWIDCWGLLFNKEISQRLAVPVLDVVLLDRGRPRRWLFTDKDGFVRTKMQHNLSWQRIKAGFRKAMHGTQQYIATAWRQVANSTEAVGLSTAELSALASEVSDSSILGSGGWLADSRAAVCDAKSGLLAIQSARVMRHITTTHRTEYCTARDLTPPMRLQTHVVSSGVEVLCKEPAVQQELEVLTRRVVSHAELSAGCRVCRLGIEWVRDESGGFKLRQLFTVTLATGIKDDTMAARPPWNAEQGSSQPPPLPSQQSKQFTRQRPSSTTSRPKPGSNSSWVKSSTSRLGSRLSSAPRVNNLVQGQGRPNSARTRMRPSVIQCLPNTSRSLPSTSRSHIY